MSLNSTPLAFRTKIGFFGLRNAGKSSLVNAIANQRVSIVSPTLGTTTDPVKKTMEILPLGPVVLIDTAGIDDIGELGGERVKKTYELLDSVDVAVLVINYDVGISKNDKNICEKIIKRKIPYMVVFTHTTKDVSIYKKEFKNALSLISADLNNPNSAEKIRDILANIKLSTKDDGKLLENIVKKGDIVLLSVPIDQETPKGRLILPQQQTIREILDIGATSVITNSCNVSFCIEQLKSKPKIVITDSQCFSEVEKQVNNTCYLTSFSILLAKAKGQLDLCIEAVKRIKILDNNCYVLISEGCSHNIKCDDIGRYKIPSLLKKITNKNFNFEFTQGNEFPTDLKKYSLVIHCGGCMQTKTEMQYRYNLAREQNVPIVNYGVFIAFANGILDKALEVFLK